MNNTKNWQSVENLQNRSSNIEFIDDTEKLNTSQNVTDSGQREKRTISTIVECGEAEVEKANSSQTMLLDTGSSIDVLKFEKINNQRSALQRNAINTNGSLSEASDNVLVMRAGWRSRRTRSVMLQVEI